MESGKQRCRVADEHTRAALSAALRVTTATLPGLQEQELQLYHTTSTWHFSVQARRPPSLLRDIGHRPLAHTLTQTYRRPVVAVAFNF